MFGCLSRASFLRRLEPQFEILHADVIQRSPNPWAILVPVEQSSDFARCIAQSPYHSVDSVLQPPVSLNRSCQGFPPMVSRSTPVVHSTIKKRAFSSALWVGEHAPGMDHVTTRKTDDTVSLDHQFRTFCRWDSSEELPPFSRLRSARSRRSLRARLCVRLPPNWPCFSALLSWFLPEMVALKVAPVPEAALVAPVPTRAPMYVQFPLGVLGVAPRSFFRHSKLG